MKEMKLKCWGILSSSGNLLAACGLGQSDDACGSGASNEATTEQENSSEVIIDASEKLLAKKWILSSEKIKVLI